MQYWRNNDHDIDDGEEDTYPNMVDYFYGEGHDCYGWWGLVISLMTFKWYNKELFWSLENLLIQFFWTIILSYYFLLHDTF
jgi:hypothetical protein